jgi:single-stranded-DNA-specific exonuclease
MAIPASAEVRSNTSRINKRIRVKRQRDEAAGAIAAKDGVHPVVARILAARGFEANAELDDYLSPTLRKGIPAPSSLKNLTAACSLIKECHERKEGIAICCDFDVDGLSGGSLVYDFFQNVGIDSQVYVPDRFVDGYGLNERTVRQIAERGFGLLLTIDFGTTNVKELTLARELGLKTIVVDHHHISADPPPVDVFINPHQVGCGFAKRTACAAGLAWYLVVGLRQLYPDAPVDAKSFLDLACLGTICDMVPLVGLNRVIAKRGLELLSDTSRAGLRALRNVAGIKGNVGCGDVSFGIGPRLNAAGRIVSGNLVVELLTTKDSVRADKLARQLNQLNAERQELEQVVKAQAIEQLEAEGGITWAAVAYNPEFHTGVIGIVAQRLVEHFYRPSAVMGMDTEGILKGSVRGIKGFSVIEALEAVRAHLIKFGGHEGAGGFSVAQENVLAFKDAFIRECERRLNEIEVVPFVDVDTEITLEELSMQLVEQLNGLAPFGVGNPAPTVLIRNLRVVEIKTIKNIHLKVVFSDGRRFISGMMWRQESHPALYPNARVAIAFRPEINRFNGVAELMANLQAVESGQES